MWVSEPSYLSHHCSSSFLQLCIGRTLASVAGPRHSSRRDRLFPRWVKHLPKASGCRKEIECTLEAERTTEMDVLRSRHRTWKRNQVSLGLQVIQQLTEEQRERDEARQG